MRTFNSFLASIAIHTSLLLALLYHHNRSIKIDPPISVEVIEKKYPERKDPSRSTQEKDTEKAPENNKDRPLDLKQEIKKAYKEINEQDPLKKKELIYTNYFSRIRDDIYIKWRNDVANHFRGQNITRKYTTVVYIILDNAGLVLETILISSSGDKGLDEIALNTMKSKMFPNPPKALIDSDGYCRIVWSYNVVL